MKQKRSLTLLRSLVYNITENPEDLNVKQCADVLYSLASLNYPDEVLMCRVTADLYKCIETTERPSVIKSIIQSIGMLKYRDTELLDQLSEWILKHLHTCRPQELSTLIQTLAAVNFKPSNEEVLKVFHKISLNSLYMLAKYKFIVHGFTVFFLTRFKYIV